MQVKAQDGSLAAQHAVEKTHQKVRNQQMELDLRDREAVILGSHIEKVRGEAENLRVGGDRARQGLWAAEERMAHASQELETLRNQCDELRRENAQMRLDRESEGTVLLELEHLKNDNSRLMKMLKETGHKSFGEQAEDSGGSMHFVKKNQATRVKDKREQYIQEVIGPKEEDWVPNDAFTVAQELRAKYGSELTPNLINRLLAELNKVWRARETRQIARIKQQCATASADVKRQVMMRAPLDEVAARKEIARLREELKRAREEVKNTVASSSALTKNPTMDTVKANMTAVSEANMERSRLEEDNLRLKKVVSDLEAAQKAGDADRAKWMDGACWMAEKVMREVERIRETTDGEHSLQDEMARLKDAIKEQEYMVQMGRDTSYKKIGKSLMGGTDSVVSDFKFRTLTSPNREHYK